MPGHACRHGVIEFKESILPGWVLLAIGSQVSFQTGSYDLSFDLGAFDFLLQVRARVFGISLQTHHAYFKEPQKNLYVGSIPTARNTSDCERFGARSNPEYIGSFHFVLRTGTISIGAGKNFKPGICQSFQTHIYYRRFWNRSLGKHTG